MDLIRVEVANSTTSCDAKYPSLKFHIISPTMRIACFDPQVGLSPADWKSLIDAPSYFEIGSTHSIVIRDDVIKLRTHGSCGHSSIIISRPIMIDAFAEALRITNHYVFRRNQSEAAAFCAMHPRYNADAIVCDVIRDHMDDMSTMKAIARRQFRSPLRVEAMGRRLCDAAEYQNNEATLFVISKLVEALNTPTQ